MKPHGLRVIAADAITDWLSTHTAALPDLVCETYLQHAKGKTNNPDSYFLRFPDDAKNRIIALPCSLEDDKPVSGVKWIASFPDNIHKGLDRASAVIVMNDRHTGYPVALLEGSQISLARTAASATLGALHLHPTPKKVACMAVVGCGPIAAATVQQMLACGFHIEQLVAIDLDRLRAQRFLEKFTASISLRSVESDISALSMSDVILFATSAGIPYVNDTSLFKHHPTVLHISLRDLNPDVIRVAQNFTDDTAHCLKANTSLHLTVQQDNRMDFIAGTIADVVEKKVEPDWSKTRIYSPFGMGVLDLAIAREIFEQGDKVRHTTIENFLPLAFAG